jgi:putative heme-binding domain-containing protein
VMAKASTQEELMHYLFHLRTAKDWTPAQRKEYLEYWLKVREGYNHDAVVMRWFDEAGRPYGDGASFNNFLKNFLKDATASLTPTEKDEVTPVLNDIAANPSGRKGKSDFPPAKARQTVQEWTVADLAGSLDAASKGRNYERGRQAFVDAQCLACHRFGREGGGVGPDLTAVSSRFARRDLLESIVEPSKVLSQQFENTTVTLKDGESITGRLVEETPETLVLLPNPLQPDAKIRVEKKKVASKSASKISPMPTNLVDGLSREEILDLLAFIESSGRRQHPSFQQ